MCVFIHIYPLSAAPRGQKRVSSSLVLELQTAVMRVLGIELRSAGRVVSGLNH